jgi:ABC-type sugar transport system substrate-binding protein
VEVGAAKAVRDLNAGGVSVELIWKCLIREGDHEEHKQIVENSVRKGVYNIVLSPFDSQFLIRTVEDAARKNVPIVVIDAVLDTPRIASFVGTGKQKAGAPAADRRSELLRGHAKATFSATKKLRRAQTHARTASSTELSPLIRTWRSSAPRNTVVELAFDAFLRLHAHFEAALAPVDESSTF